MSAMEKARKEAVEALAEMHRFPINELAKSEAYWQLEHLFKLVTGEYYKEHPILDGSPKMKIISFNRIAKDAKEKTDFERKKMFEEYKAQREKEEEAI